MKNNKIKKNNTEDNMIRVKGARTHNLKNIDVEIPRGKLTVISGLSGSGKSSLAFDTIFAEGQRRYVESLSAYARQFLNQMQKPDVDEISGLSPAISIDQKSRSNNPRSTVATITEIYDYLRVLFARVGKPHCLECGRAISRMSVDQIAEFFIKKIKEAQKIINKKIEENEISKKEILGIDIENSKIMVFAPVVRERKGEYYQLLYDLLSSGYSYVRVDGKIHSLRNQIRLTKTKKHTIEVLIDEFYFSEIIDEKGEEKKGQEKKDFETRLKEAIEKSITQADGLFLGVFEFDLDSKEESKIFYNKKIEKKSEKVNEKVNEKQENASHFPTKNLEETSKEFQKEFLLSSKYACPYDGFSFGELEPRIFSFNSPVGACQSCNGLGTKTFGGKEVCEECNGYRLNNNALCVFLETENSVEEKSKTTPILEKEFYKKGLNIVDVTSLSISDAVEFFANLELSKKDLEIAKPILREIRERISFMNDVGLEYVTLDRRANTLSGGEAQRIRLASQLGSGLVGATYVLDEPTIGLHQRDNDRLVKTLLKMRDMGNTVIVVEHDEDVLFSADYLVDIGPKAGINGGEVIVQGYLKNLLSDKKNVSSSKTLAYLREEEMIEMPKKRREKDKGKIKITGANIHNIKNQNIEIPIGKLTVISGVSGSGKSSFLYGVLYQNLQAKFDRAKRSNNVYNCAKIEGLEKVSRAVLINQSAIGRTPRSNPATYTGAFTFIREIFAETSEAKVRGYKAGRFSFNVSGGRCENCSGNGYVKVEMHFLPAVYVKCDVCEGKRFNNETLEVKFKEKNISEVLEMSIDKAYEFFKDIPAISDRLKTLVEVGLGYLRLGQSATTLSGGEAQRVKIASELYRPFLEKAVYLLDEPTVGLHYDDVEKLNNVLQILVNRGNTVIVIEHNLDLVKIADYVLDFGPVGGSGGGKVVAKGTPEEIVNNKNSVTGEYLKDVLKKTRKFYNKK